LNGCAAGLRFPEDPEIRTWESLSAIFGIGTRKLEKYAGAFLEIIQGHCHAHLILEPIPIPYQSAIFVGFVIGSSTYF
jgi:hypothetical protein